VEFSFLTGDYILLILFFLKLVDLKDETSEGGNSIPSKLYFEKSIFIL